MEKKEMAEEQLGAPIATTGNRKYVNLRVGAIAETSKEQEPGFAPAKTVNKSGVENHFFAKRYEYLSGYVTEIKKRISEFDGVKVPSWNITIDTTREIFVLQVNANDRPYSRVMSVLAAVDFSRPIRFVGFMGKYQGKNQKVLNIYQGGEKPVQPAIEAKWLSQAILKKIKEQVPLTEDEEKNIARNSDGSINKDYPYIKEKSDGTGWKFDEWTEHLTEMMEEQVIPACVEANVERGAIPRAEGYVLQAPNDDHGDAWEGDDPYTDAPPADTRDPFEDVPW